MSNTVLKKKKRQKTSTRSSKTSNSKLSYSVKTVKKNKDIVFEVWQKNSLGKKSTILFENEYCGQKIILAAIYEKGVLREDVMNMFETAKKLGAYVLCVNTMKLEKPKEKQ